MSELVEKLLQPVSAEQPCGPDLSNDPVFDELEAVLKGKPEVEIGSVVKPAEPPDWGELLEKSLEFFQGNGDRAGSKHLRVAVILCGCWLRTGGVVGFVDGLQLIRGLLEQYWASMYPLLDPEDNNDPTQRLNLLGTLTKERGAMGLGWLAILDQLYTAPICRPKGGPAVTYDDLAASKQKASGEEGAPATAPDPAKLAAALRGAGDGQVESHYQALQQALEATQGIDQFLTSTLTAGNTISFEVLEKTLKEMIEGLVPFLPGGSGAIEGGGSAGTSGDAGDSGAAGGGISVRGEIRSRNDVVTALERICDYYGQVEPCSPVPYLLHRAQKLAQMNFVEAVQELNIATLDSLKPSMGSGVEGGGGGESPPPSE